MITRLDDDPVKNAERWKKLPYLMDYQDPGTPKPGAVVLAEMNAGGRKMPMLITENYGRGRTAVLATSGTWRWQMASRSAIRRHDAFWRQLLRWLVTDTPGNVVASVPSQMLFDDGRVRISADVRDKEYQPAADAQVEAHILGPGGTAAPVEMTPDPGHARVVPGGLERRSAGVVCRRGDGNTRRSGTGARRADISAHGRSR